MKMDFYDTDHASAYLSNSIVRDGKGQPVRIHAVESCSDSPKDWRVAVHPIGNKRDRAPYACMLSNLNLEPLPLGFVNVGRIENDRETGIIQDAFYLQRRPIRGWKVGLTNNSLGIVNLRKGDLDSDYVQRTSRNITTVQGFYDMVMGKYPSPVEAMQMLRRTRMRSVAFSRRFALTGRGALMYKFFEAPAGEWDGTSINLNKDFSLLQEQLTEDLGG